MTAILAWLAVLLTVTAADIRVVDGDTIDARGENWRLSGYGAEHIEIVARSGRHRYRRRLGLLLLDGADVVDIMIEEGAGAPLPGRAAAGMVRRWVAAVISGGRRSFSIKRWRVIPTIGTASSSPSRGRFGRCVHHKLGRG